MNNIMDIKESKSIGVLLTSLKSGFDSEIIRGIQYICNEENYSILLTNSSDKESSVMNCIHHFLEKKVDGIIMVGGNVNKDFYNKVQDLSIPIVAISCEIDFEPTSKFATVTIDNENAAYDAVDYIIKAGHTKIAMISGEKTEPNAGAPRIEGYKLALENHNIPFREDYLIEASYTYFSGYDAASAIISFKDKPTAIFVASDAMAIGAMRALLELGLKIPDDIAIFGFDGIDYTEYCYPSLSTISQPRFEMGCNAMTTLLKFIKNENVPEHKIILDHVLIQRESC